MIAIVLAFAWYFLGILGFIFWWTSEYDFKTTDLILSLIIAFVGPFSFIMGYFIHGTKKYKEPIVLIKKRK